MLAALFDVSRTARRAVKQNWFAKAPCYINFRNPLNQMAFHHASLINGSILLTSVSLYPTNDDATDMRLIVLCLFVILGSLRQEKGRWQFYGAGRFFGGGAQTCRFFSPTFLFG